MSNPNLVNFQRGEFDPVAKTVKPTVNCAVDSTTVYLVDGFKGIPDIARIYYRVTNSATAHIDVVGSPRRVVMALSRIRPMDEQ